MKKKQIHIYQTIDGVKTFVGKSDVEKGANTKEILDQLTDVVVESEHICLVDEEDAYIFYPPQGPLTFQVVDK